MTALKLRLHLMSGRFSPSNGPRLRLLGAYTHSKLKPSPCLPTSFWSRPRRELYRNRGHKSSYHIPCHKYGKPVSLLSARSRISLSASICPPFEELIESDRAAVTIVTGIRDLHHRASMFRAKAIILQMHTYAKVTSCDALRS